MVEGTWLSRLAKKSFLLQNLQENTCNAVFFSKFESLQPAILLNKDSVAGVFFQILETFSEYLQNNYFTAASRFRKTIKFYKRLYIRNWSPYAIVCFT